MSVVQLNPHEKMTVEQCLSYVSRNTDDLTDVIVIGYDPNGELVVRSSHMSRAESLWLLMAAIDHSRGLPTNTG